MKSIIVILLIGLALVVFIQYETYSQTDNPRAKIGNGIYVSPDVSTRTGLLYISHITLDYVSVLDPESNQLIGKIKAGEGPCSIELSSDKGYIGNFWSNDITVFNKKTGNTIATIPAGGHPTHLVLTADSLYLLIGHESADGLWIMDIHTNKIVNKLAEGIGILCRHEKEKIVYQSQISTPFVFVIDPERQMIVKKIDVGGRPLELAFTPNQKYLYVANFDLSELEKIDIKTNSVVARISQITNARGIAITHDGRLAYVTNVKSATVMVVDLASAAIVKVIKVGRMPTSVAFRTDGKYAYVSCQGNASISVIDTKTQEVDQSIAVGDNPIMVQVK